MSKQLADVQIHTSHPEDNVITPDDYNDVSVDLIDDRLYLGNLISARDTKTLETLKITHILTIDLVPLPRSILDRRDLTLKFVKLADVPKEDLITHLPSTNDFIKQAIGGGGNVLVHCYFGVSRSAAIVIAYIMEKYSLCYEDAFTLVRNKRVVGPNAGFIAQLKLFGHMSFKLNREDPRYKQFRLKLAGQKLKQVKILPQLFADLVKTDPGLVRERPDPVVYRCKKCRRVVASQRNIIPHIPKRVKIELVKKGARPPPGDPAANVVESGQLVRKLESLALQGGGEAGGRPHAHCRLMWFVEPMAWMRDVQHEPQGKLHCPKCQNKIGSFNWVMGCRCPCGQKVAPAFYLVPSKVEWSNIVQNVQITV